MSVPVRVSGLKVSDGVQRVLIAKSIKFLTSRFQND